MDKEEAINEIKNIIYIIANIDDLDNLDEAITYMVRNGENKILIEAIGKLTAYEHCIRIIQKIDK